LTLSDRMDFLPLTDPSSTDSVGQVKVSHHINAEKCG